MNTERELKRLKNTTFKYQGKDVYLANWFQDAVFLKPTHKGKVLHNSISKMVLINIFFNSLLKDIEDSFGVK